MPLFNIKIEMHTDWFEAKVDGTIVKWAVGDTFSISGPRIGAFQMNSRLIGLGKDKPWDVQPIVVNAFVDTVQPRIAFFSRKGAAGPVLYTSYDAKGNQIAQVVHLPNVDPPRLEISLTFRDQALRQQEAAEGDDSVAKHETLRTIMPSDE